MDLLLVDTTGSVALQVYNQAGALVDMDAAPTVTVKDGGGATLSTGTATHTGTGSYAFPIAPTVLDELTIVWDGAISTNDAVFTTHAEVVGSVPLVPADIRAVDEDLADTAKYPDAKVQSAIEQAWETIEKGMRVAIVPRGHRETVDGSGSTSQLIDKLECTQVYSATVDGATVNVAGLRPKRHGAIINPSGWPYDSVVELHYRHGLTATPEPVLAALITLTVDRLVTRATPARATSLSTDVGAFRLTIAGRDGWTGIPDVDAVIEQYGLAVGFA